MKNWNVRKTIVTREEMPEHHRLAQSLSWPHLVALGVGAIVGTGIAFAALHLGHVVAESMNDAGTCISTSGSTCPA